MILTGRKIAATARQRHWSGFESDCEELFVAWFGADHKMDRKRLLDTFYRIDSCEDLPRNEISVYSHALREVIRAEKQKADARQ